MQGAAHSGVAGNFGNLAGVRNLAVFVEAGEPVLYTRKYYPSFPLGGDADDIDVELFVPLLASLPRVSGTRGLLFFCVDFCFFVGGWLDSEEELSAPSLLSMFGTWTVVGTKVCCDDCPVEAPSAFCLFFDRIFVTFVPEALGAEVSPEDPEIAMRLPQVFAKVQSADCQRYDGINYPFFFLNQTYVGSIEKTGLICLSKVDQDTLNRVSFFESLDSSSSLKIEAIAQHTVSLNNTNLNHCFEAAVAGMMGDAAEVSESSSDESECNQQQIVQVVQKDAAEFNIDVPRVDVTSGESSEDECVQDNETTFSSANSSSDSELNDEFDRDRNESFNPSSKSQPLYDGSPITIQEHATLLMVFLMRCKLPWQQVSMLLDLVSAHLPVENNAIKSIYMLKKVFIDSWPHSEQRSAGQSAGLTSNTSAGLVLLFCSHLEITENSKDMPTMYCCTSQSALCQHFFVHWSLSESKVHLGVIAMEIMDFLTKVSSVVCDSDEVVVFEILVAWGARLRFHRISTLHLIPRSFLYLHNCFEHFYKLLDVWSISKVTERRLTRTVLPLHAIGTGCGLLCGIPTPNAQCPRELVHMVQTRMCNMQSIVQNGGHLAVPSTSTNDNAGFNMINSL
ncbi:hypothetical protein B566_EDAN013330 [Ephemera danica]|nr:hypothetical protein B566_EDAN013330 [Ephemera danica]